MIRPITGDIIRMYNLVQLGVSVDINDLTYEEGYYLMYFSGEIQKEDERKMKQQSRGMHR